MKIVVFDLDDTLVELNTTFDFIKFYLWRTSKTRYLEFILLEEVSFLFDYRKLAISFLNGADKKRLYKIAEDFFAYSEPRLNRELLLRLESLKNDGYKTFLISGTIDCTAYAFAHNLGFDEYYSSKLKFSDGKCLGYLEDDIVGRKEEILRSNLKYDINFEGSYCFSDNRDDADFLAIFGNPCAIVRRGSLYRSNVAFWESKHIQNIILNQGDDYPAVLAVIPFSYALYTNTIRKPYLKNIFIANYFVLQLINLLFFGINFSVTNLFLFLLAFLAFYSVYEIGYAVNDVRAFREESPNIKIKRSFKDKLAEFILLKLLLFIILSTILIYLNINVTIFVLLAFATAIIFMVHNFVGERSIIKLFTNPILKISKIVVPFSIFNNHVLWVALPYVIFASIYDASLYFNDKIKKQPSDKVVYWRKFAPARTLIFLILLLLYILSRSTLLGYLLLGGAYFIVLDISYLFKNIKMILPRTSMRNSYL